MNVIFQRVQEWRIARGGDQVVSFAQPVRLRRKCLGRRHAARSLGDFLRGIGDFLLGLGDSFHNLGGSLRGLGHHLATLGKGLEVPGGSFPNFCGWTDTRGDWIAALGRGLAGLCSILSSLGNSFQPIGHRWAFYTDFSPSATAGGGAAEHFYPLSQPHEGFFQY